MRDAAGFHLNRRGRRDARDFHNVALALNKLAVVASFDRATMTFTLLRFGEFKECKIPSRDFGKLVSVVTSDIARIFDFQPPKKCVRPAIWKLTGH